METEEHDDQVEHEEDEEENNNDEQMAHSSSSRCLSSSSSPHAPLSSNSNAMSKIKTSLIESLLTRKLPNKFSNNGENSPEGVKASNSAFNKVAFSNSVVFNSEPNASKINNLTKLLQNIVEMNQLNGVNNGLSRPMSADNMNSCEKYMSIKAESSDQVIENSSKLMNSDGKILDGSSENANLDVIGYNSSSQDDQETNDQLKNNM
jgi:hypothetical protein